MTRDSGKTRAATEQPTDPLLQLIHHAYAPTRLDPGTNDRLIESALGPLSLGQHAQSSEFSAADPTADTSMSDGLVECEESCDSKECADAERLALALECDGVHPLAELAEALRAAYRPPIAVDAFVEKLAHQISQSAVRPQDSNVLSFRPRVWPVATAMALAAAAALWITRANDIPSVQRDAQLEPLVQSRSVAPLFVETLPPASTTERIDRIYAVRSRELRENRYTSWRVR